MSRSTQLGSHRGPSIRGRGRRLWSGGTEHIASLSLVAFGLGLALSAGCAKIRSPGGGPEDKDPPYVARSVPDSAATGVGAIDTLLLVFTEPMDRRSVVESFRITPQVDFLRQTWEEDTLTLALAAPLDSNQTYVAMLGAETRDRRRNTFGHPWIWPFATGGALDAGAIAGRVIGAQYKPGGLYVYVWPWESGPPDTTESYFPDDPIRLAQTDREGAFAVDFLPLSVPLRLCAFYDRDGDGSYQPLPDRWACAEEAIVLADTAMTREEVEIFLAEREEPGVIAGTVVDSLCLSLDPRATLRAVRAQRDSLLEWLSGEWEARQRGRATITEADSLRIEDEMARFERAERDAIADSLHCVLPVRVSLWGRGDSLVAETGGPEFRFADVEPGIYRLSAFRDVDADGARSPGEATGRFPFALEVRPLRTLDELVLPIQVPGGEEPLRAPADSSGLPAGRVADESPQGEDGSGER